MATAAQIAANRQNAQLSTGPRTLEGKQNSARNAVVDRLFSAPGNFVRPGEQSEWDEFNTAFLVDLAPHGALETSIASELIRASWRLRRCSNVEATLAARLADPTLDPMEDTATISTQNSIDRARTQAQRIFDRALSNLQRLQTERLFRNEYFPEGTPLTGFGVARLKEIIPAIHKLPRDLTQDEAVDQTLTKLLRMTTLASTKPVDPATPKLASFCTPRNAPCPCGSGAKYKRCCGTDAPPVLSAPPSAAAEPRI
jgi:hypothetical protein